MVEAVLAVAATVEAVMAGTESSPPSAKHPMKEEEEEVPLKKPCLCSALLLGPLLSALLLVLLSALDGDSGGDSGSGRFSVALSKASTLHCSFLLLEQSFHASNNLI